METNWEDFIHSAAAVGSSVRIEVTPEERASWPMPPSVELEPDAHFVEFDPWLRDGTVGTVVGMSNCGWLKVEVADHGVTDIPGWYLKPAARALRTAS